MKNESQLSRIIAVSSCAGVMLSLLVASGCGSGRGPFLPPPGKGGGLGGIGIGPAPVNMGSAGNFVVLAETQITDPNPSTITGNVGLSPATGANNHVPCGEVTGLTYSVNGAGPLPCSLNDPSTLTTAIGDKGTAYTDAASRAPDYTELGAGNISGLTLTPATYKWSSGLLINTDVTLSGGPNDVWIFEIAQTLTLANGIHVNLAGGALPQNIYWQVASTVSLGTTSVFKGTVITQADIVANSGAKVNGKLLAHTQITLNGATVSP